MSAHPAQATPPTDPSPQAADAAYYRQALHALIDMGTVLARRLHDQAIAEPAPAPQAPQPAPPDLVAIAAAFDKVARTVRRCIMLAQRGDQPDPARPRAAARRRILREVEDAIQRPGHDGPDAPEALAAELRERLDAPDLDDDLRGRPVADIIQDICRDLGLGAHPGTRPWKRRTPADVADLCARAAAQPRAARHPATPQAPVSQAPAAQAPAAQASVTPMAGHGSPHVILAPPNGHPPHCTQSAPTHPRGPVPDDPAEAVAAILHAIAETRWRQPLPT